MIKKWFRALYDCPKLLFSASVLLPSTRFLCSVNRSFFPLFYLGQGLLIVHLTVHLIVQTTSLIRSWGHLAGDILNISSIAQAIFKAGVAGRNGLLLWRPTNNLEFFWDKHLNISVNRSKFTTSILYLYFDKVLSIHAKIICYFTMIVEIRSASSHLISGL